MCESCDLAFSPTVLQSIMDFRWQHCVVCSCTYSVDERSLNVTLSGWTVRPSHQQIATRYFRSGVAEDSVLLRYDALSGGSRIRMFRSKLSVVIFKSRNVLEQNRQANQDRTTNYLHCCTVHFLVYLSNTPTNVHI
jgi:hypothetical protein